MRRGLIKDYDSIIQDFVDKLTILRNELLSHATMVTQVTVYRILNIVEKIGKVLVISGFMS